MDTNAGTVRLDPGTTKNGDGRLFPFTQQLRDVIEGQRAYTDRVQRERGEVIPWVFHHDGQPVRDFYTAWRRACREAGLPGMRLHDLRRTAVRNTVRVGVPDVVAMQLSGHRTRSVFDRYNIVSENDLHDAAAKLDQAESVKVGVKVAGLGTPPRPAGSRK